jgi:surfactin synthase thioesterase subunit
VTPETAPVRHGQDRFRMFCFPPSGASGQMYALWRNQIPKSIELVGVDYPGRAGRSDEVPIAHLETLAETLAAALLPDTDEPFALLGQSMGGLVAFEVAHRLAQRNRLPLHLFVCACRAPGQNVHSLIHQLPDDAFLAELDRRVGRQRHNDMALLRADITAAERYWAPPERCVACPISVIGGLEDGLHSRSALAQWCNRTTGRFSLQFVPGGHFFRGHLDRVAAVIAAELDRSVAEHCAN